MFVWNVCIVQENDFFSQDGIPKNPFPNGWKGKAGLYAVGFTRRGLSGAALDAINVAHDISKSWKEETMLFFFFFFCVSIFVSLVSRLISQIEISLCRVVRTQEKGTYNTENLALS